MRRWQRRFLIAGLVIVAMIGLGVGVLRHESYSASPTAERAAAKATTSDWGLYFKPTQTKGPTVIFYPGALVAPASYSIWAKQVAAAGYPVAIVRFPLDLAVLASNAAQRVPVDRYGYVIGGHSLGGVMASRYAVAHPRHLRGVYLLASYPDAKGNLRQANTAVLSLTGTRDGVLNRQQWQKAKQYLPKTTQFDQLAGGNHAGFGSYGPQRGDRQAMVSNARQQRWVAGKLIAWLRQ